MREASWAELAPGPSAQAWVPNGSLQRSQRYYRKRDARKEAAVEGRNRQIGSVLSSAGADAQRTLAHAWRARTPPSREPPFHPGNRGSAAGRARAGRGRAGPLRDGTGQAEAEVAGLEGSSGSILGFGNRFRPKGLVPRHGLAESKWGPARVGGWAGRAGLGGGGRGRAWDPPEPTRPDLRTRGMRAPRR